MRTESHQTPYSSIFHIKFKSKFSCVRWEDCWKRSNILKRKKKTQTLRNAIKLNLDVKVMRCSDSPENSETFSSQIKESYKSTRAWGTPYKKVKWYLRRLRSYSPFQSTCKEEAPDGLSFGYFNSHQFHCLVWECWHFFKLASSEKSYRIVELTSR